MQVVNITEAQNNFEAIFDTVFVDNDEVVVNRKGKENIVMIPFDEYNSIKETNYLLNSPKNAKRLEKSIKQLKDGKGKEKRLLKCD